MNQNISRAYSSTLQPLHEVFDKFSPGMGAPIVAPWLITALHYLTPAAVILLCKLSGLTRKKASSKNRKPENDLVTFYSSFSVLLPSLGILASYLLQSATLLNCLFSYSIFSQGESITCSNQPPDDLVINSLASFLVWSILLLSDKIPRSTFDSILSITAISEFLLLASATRASEAVGSLFYTNAATRLCILITLLFFAMIHYSGVGSSRQSIASLPGLATNGSKIAEEKGADDSESEGSIPLEWDDGDWEEDRGLERMMRANQIERFKSSESWWEYIKPFKVLLRFVFPEKDATVVTLVSIKTALIFAQRAVPPLLTRQLGIVTDRLLAFANITDSSASSSALSYTLTRDVAIWFFLTWLSSAGGLSAGVYRVERPLKNMSTRAITLAGYDHIMSLSAEFHNSMNPCSVIASIAYTNSMYRVFDKFVYSLIPALFDLIIGGVYLYILFGPYTAFILVIAAYAYVWSDLHFKSRAMSCRRASNKAWIAQYNTQERAVEGWRAVRIFNNFKFERERLARSINNRMDRELDLQNVNFMDQICTCNTMMLALLPVCVLAVLSIRAGNAPVGHFVAMTSTWMQLSGPLTTANELSKELLESLVNVERLLYVLSIKPDVVDAPDAKPLEITKCNVTFENVCFAYDERKPVLHDICLDNTAGRTIALVGESGGGKSTILQLISRLYDVSEGAIKIDGQDIRQVTQESLREAIGTVPQSPHMFNASILENLRYAMRGSTFVSEFDGDDDGLGSSSSSSSSSQQRIKSAGKSTVDEGQPATEAEKEKIYAACRAASIHDKILSFPDGYASLVGENGIKLSGGELQRIAIAQVLLQNPRLVLLDEATSAVDTLTERQIQAALRQLAHGRTAFVIAHRLSTIVAADEILVMHQGEIVERGTHAELVQREHGKYRALWNEQVLASQAVSS